MKRNPWATWKGKICIIAGNNFGVGKEPAIAQSVLLNIRLEAFHAKRPN